MTIGVLTDSGYVDLNGASGKELPASMIEFLEQGDAAMESAKTLATSAAVGQPDVYESDVEECLLCFLQGLLPGPSLFRFVSFLSKYECQAFTGAFVIINNQDALFFVHFLPPPNHADFCFSVKISSTNRSTSSISSGL